MPEPLLNAQRIRDYLTQVADLLGEGPPCVVVVAGGSLLALHGLRQATRDVDSIGRLDADVRGAAASVAERHGLPAGWLNDNAAAWWPAGLTADMCEVELERGRLRVLRVTHRYVFVMKLEASRAVDQPDLRRIWPHTGFRSADEAAALWHTAYPHQDSDPYLADHIRRVVG